MATFKAQIEDLTGSIGDDAALTQWLTDGAKELINIFPFDLKMECSTMTALTSSTPMDLDASGDILYVTRENADSGYHTACRKVPSIYGGLTSDSSNMMYYATATDPAFWTESDTSGDPKLFVKPDPTASQPARVHHVTFPTVAYGDSAVVNFPDEAEYLLVLYAAIKGLHRLMNNKIPDLPSDGNNIVLSETTLSLPTFTAPSPIVLPATPVVPSLSENSVSITGTAPTYTQPALALIAKPVISDLSITATAPTIPSVPSLVYSNAEVGDAVSEAVNAVSQAQDAVSEAQDAYTGEVEHKDTQSSSINYTAPTIAGDADELTSVARLDTDNTVDDYDGNIIEFDQWFATLSHFIEGEEDVELAAAQIQKIQSYISAFQTQMENSSNVMQKSIVQHQSDINIKQASINSISSASTARMNQSTSASIAKMNQSTSAAIAKMNQSTSAAIQKMSNSTNVNIQNAAKSFESMLEEYKLKLSRFQNELALYGEEIQKELQVYQQNNTKNIQLWQEENKVNLEKFSQDMSNELNKFNKENAEYQAILQKDLKDSELKESKANRDLQKYSQELSSYQNEVASKVQEFQTTLQKNMETFNSDINKYNAELAKVNADNQNKIGKFQADIANYGAKIQKHNTEYQWYQSQYAMLKQDYNQGIQMLVGGGMPQQQKGER